MLIDLGQFPRLTASNTRCKRLEHTLIADTAKQISPWRRAMKAVGRQGSIVNVSSIAGVSAGFDPAGYTASKTAVVGVTKLAGASNAPLT